MSPLLSLSSSLPEMLCFGLVRSSAVLTIVVIFTVSQIEVSSARTVSLGDGYWSNTGDISKRNSWWSKKSLESSPDYQTLLQEAAYENSLVDSSADRDSLPVYSSLYRCYVTECVPKFVQCAQRSRTVEDYKQCKDDHEMCALVCRSLLSQQPLI